MYVYLQSEPGLWTVGFYDPRGYWHPESDHATRDSAASRVSFLNGGDEIAAQAVTVATCRGRTADEAIANARLIAAVPDLLSALQECAEYGALTWEHDPDNEPNCYRAAREAIAKAIGDD